MLCLGEIHTRIALNYLLKFNFFYLYYTHVLPKVCPVCEDKLADEKFGMMHLEHYVKDMLPYYMLFD